MDAIMDWSDENETQLAQAPSPFTLLPTELLIKIAANSESLSDLLSFSATCSRFYAIFHQNTFDIARHVIPRCVQYDRQAWALVSVQEDVPVEVARGPRMTPRHVQRLARNGSKLDKTIQWFNLHEMKHVRPDNLETCIKVWGSAARPPHLTNSERRRFQLAYYLAAMLMEDPKGIDNMLGDLPLRYVYYVADMSKLYAPIGEEDGRRPGELYTEKRRLLQLACRARMEKLWSQFYPTRELRYRNTLDAGKSFGCHGPHLALYDHYQSRAQYELRPGASWAAYSDVNISLEDMKRYIWGEEVFDVEP